MRNRWAVAGFKERELYIVRKALYEFQRNQGDAYAKAYSHTFDRLPEELFGTPELRVLISEINERIQIAQQEKH